MGMRGYGVTFFWEVVLVFSFQVVVIFREWVEHHGLSQCRCFRMFRMFRRFRVFRMFRVFRVFRVFCCDCRRRRRRRRGLEEDWEEDLVEGWVWEDNEEED